MYEQGIADSLDGTPLFTGTTAGVHESQSRLWENLVGRSLPFWRHWYASLQATFPGELGDVDIDTFYRAINRVVPSLIRTEADEVTYNLHVMLRFDLELAMLEGSLAVADLPEAWRARVQSDLGVTPARRPRRCAAGRALVRRHCRRAVPELHARQHHERAVLRRGATRPLGSRRADRHRRVRAAAHVAHRATSTAMAASSRRPRSSSARQASRCRSRPTSATSRPSTARCTLCDGTPAPCGKRRASAVARD